MLAAVSPAFAQCDPTWTPVPGLRHVPDETFVLATATWDPDGTGPAPLHAVFGGLFAYIGDVAANHVAAWDGSAWRSLSDGPAPGQVNALQEFGGHLYAGTPTGVYEFDGAAWTRPGGAAAASVLYVYELAVLDDGLYAIGGLHGPWPNEPRVRRWDGKQWTDLPPLPGPALNFPHTIAEHNGSLYAGGKYMFALDDFTPLVRWTGAAWERIPWVAPTMLVWGARTLLSSGDSLVVGGRNGGGFDGSIMRWDGNEWHAFGPGLGGTIAWINDLTEFQGNLYAMGTFSNSGGRPMSRIARWDGAAWNALPAMAHGNSAEVGIAFDNRLLFAGFLNYLWSWDGHTLSNDFGAPALDGACRVASYDGQLVASGALTIGVNRPVAMLAALSGSTWFPLGQQSHTGVLLPDGSDLYAAVSQRSTAAGTALGIARWDGAAWFPLGSGVSGGGTQDRVLALAKHGGDLIAGGTFDTAGAQPAARIARWDGSNWHALGAGIGDGQVNDLLAVSSPAPAVYAAGSFTLAGGEPASRIAMWNGLAWSPLGEGLNDSVHALARHQGLVIAGGMFTSAGGMPAPGVAGWTGATWLPLGEGLNGPVHDLAVFEGDLYAVGPFTASGSTPMEGVARWDGQAWHSVNADFEGFPRSITEHEGRLYVGGMLLQVNGQPTGLVAELTCGNPCRPDLTTTAVPGSPGYGMPNGALNNDDFFYYLTAFAAGNLAVADLTTTAVSGSPGYGVPNGVLNNDDFFYYLTVFAAGC